jgi:hypothetical protein
MTSVSSNGCQECGHEIPLAWNHCPHCGRPGLFPNVRAAQAEAETKGLDQRYQKALADATNRGASSAVASFEAAVADSKAVMSRPLRELDRLASSDKELMSTFYKLLGSEVRLPHGNEWDGLRRIADEALFPGYKEEIRFAALTLDGVGLPSYGDCSLVLRDDMIAHRASVFEENSTVFLKRHAYDPPAGHRAAWDGRARLGVAKLGAGIAADTPAAGFPEILLRPGATGQDDHFVEVHIWGSLTLRSMEKVIMKTPPKGWEAFRKELRDRLRGLDVELVEAS